MKKYINPEIKLNMLDTGDIMNGSNEPTGLTSQNIGNGGGLDFASELGLEL